MPVPSASDILEHLNNEMDDDLGFGDRYWHIVKMLVPRLPKILAGRGPHVPAVDLASGEAYYPLAYAHALRNTTLAWYPTEYRGPVQSPAYPEGCMGRMLSTLSWMQAQARAGDEKVPLPLLADRNGNTLHVGDVVVLKGLANDHYNATCGVVQGCDLSSPDRVALRGIVRTDTQSFKPANMIRLSVPGPRPNSQHDATIIQGLIDRARLVDLLNRSTWSSVSELEGRCAVVTCTSLLTCLGYREPHIWQSCMAVAAKLLVPGGLLLQYDTSQYGQFAHLETMTKHVTKQALGLVFEERKAEEYCGHGDIFILVWRKEERGL
jgi:hypothetical protein